MSSPSTTDVSDEIVAAAGEFIRSYEAVVTIYELLDELGDRPPGLRDAGHAQAGDQDDDQPVDPVTPVSAHSFVALGDSLISCLDGRGGRMTQSPIRYPAPAPADR